MSVFLDNLVLLLGNVATVYMIDNYFSNFFDIKKFAMKSSFRILAIMMFAIARFGLNLLQNPYINLFGVQLLMLCYVTLFFVGSKGSRLVHYIITIGILIGGEFLFAVILGFPYDLAGQTKKIGMSSIVIQYFVMILLTYFLFIITKQLSGKAKEHMPSKIFWMYTCLPLSSLGLLILTYYSGVNVVEDLSIRVLLIICSILMFLGNILMLYAFQQHSKELYQKNQLELMMVKREMEWKHQTQMLEQNEERQKFIHDITNLLKTIYGLINKEKDFEVVKMIRELNIDIEKNETKIYCENPILNVLLSEKVAEAEKKGIKVDVFIERGICIGNIREIDLIASLGNLMDNAIRGAAESTGKKEVKIKVFMEKKMFVIKINNGFNGKLKKEKGRLITTKKRKENHGLGIRSVENVAEKYNGHLSCTDNDKEFQALLYLSIT